MLDLKREPIMLRYAHSQMLVLVVSALVPSVFGQLQAAANLTQLDQYQQCLERFEFYRNRMLEIRKDCPSPLLSSCCELKRIFFTARSRVYEMKEQCNIGKRKTYVYCDMETDGGGWYVIQRRFNGKTPFNRTLEEYENGFGDASGEFWYGLKNILCLIKDKSFELRIDLEYPNGTTGYVHYKTFSMSSSSSYTASVAVFKTSSPGVKSNLFNPQSRVYIYRYGWRYTKPNFYTKENCGSNSNVGGWWDTSCRGNPNGPGPGKGSTVYAMWNDNVVTKTEVKIRQRSCVTNPALSCTEYQQY